MSSGIGAGFDGPPVEPNNATSGTTGSINPIFGNSSSSGLPMSTGIGICAGLRTGATAGASTRIGISSLGLTFLTLIDGGVSSG